MTIEGFTVQLLVIVHYLELPFPGFVEDLGQFDGEEEVVGHAVSLIIIKDKPDF